MELQWAIYAQVMQRDYYYFKADQAQRELNALRIVQLCLTGK